MLHLRVQYHAARPYASGDAIRLSWAQFIQPLPKVRQAKTMPKIAILMAPDARFHAIMAS